MVNDMRITFETNVIGQFTLFLAFVKFRLTYIIGVAQTINCLLPLLRAGHGKRVISLSSPLGDEEFNRLVDGPIPH